MKTKPIIHLAALLIIFRPVFSQGQADNSRYPVKSNVLLQQTVHDSTLNNSANHPGRFFWGEINVGYSNRGASGSMTVNFRNGIHIFSAQFYKSHTCYKDGKKREYFLNESHSENHFTIESMAVLSGISFRGKLNPLLSAGISCSRYKYVSTVHIEHNLTLPRILETITNSDYHGERVGSQTIYTIGIPLKLTLHFAPEHFVGFDAGVKADVNMHSSFFSAELGIRLGRVIKRHSNANF